MNSATFLLAINFSVGLSFAAAFLALTWRSRVRLGRWCAAGFGFAATTVSVEALAAIIPSVRLTSTLSFGSLMVALTLIAVGLVKHYRPGAPVGYLAVYCATAIVFNIFVVFDLSRGTWAQALGYQTPFAIVAAFASGVVLVASRRHAADWALAVVLALTAVQFWAKAILAARAGHGAGVRDYIVSAYAFYSQTAGGILSILLGVTLIGVIVAAVMEEATLRLQRDALSGLLNRAAFVERAARALRRSTSTSAALMLCDLDRFKSINDRFGHAAGDEVIRRFGANLLQHFGEDALCGRVGGEEFCILLPDCSLETAQADWESVRCLGLRDRYVSIPADVAVTASFGVAIIGEGEPFDVALHPRRHGHVCGQGGRSRLLSPGACHDRTRPGGQSVSDTRFRERNVDRGVRIDRRFRPLRAIAHCGAAPRGLSRAMSDPFACPDPLAERRYAYARAAAGEGDWPTAAEVLEQALERAPAWPPALFALAEAQEKLGSHSEAAGAAYRADARGRPARTITAQRRASRGSKAALPAGFRPPMSRACSTITRRASTPI